MPGEIEHLIGIRRAAGYDEDDVRELVEWLNARPAVAFAVELSEPARPLLDFNALSGPPRS